MTTIVTPAGGIVISGTGAASTTPHDHTPIWLVPDVGRRDAITGKYDGMRVWTITPEAREVYQADGSWLPATEPWTKQHSYAYSRADMGSAAVGQFLIVDKGFGGGVYIEEFLPG